MRDNKYTYKQGEINHSHTRKGFRILLNWLALFWIPLGSEEEKNGSMDKTHLWNWPKKCHSFFLFFFYLFFFWDYFGKVYWWLNVMFKVLSRSPCHKGCCINDNVQLQIKYKFLKKTHTKTQKSLGDLDSASYTFNVVTMCFHQSKLIPLERSSICTVPSFCMYPSPSAPFCS